MNKKTENPPPKHVRINEENPAGAEESPQEPAEQNPAENKNRAAPDPFDPAQFAAPSTVLGEVGVVKELTTCPVRKPNKQEFVRVHPGKEYRLRANILELKQEKETYLVMPAVAAALPGETVLVTLRLTVSRQGAVFLWPIPENPAWMAARTPGTPRDAPRLQEPRRTGSKSSPIWHRVATTFLSPLAPWVPLCGQTNLCGTSSRLPLVKTS